MLLVFVGCVFPTAACATARLDPSIYEARRVVVASIHARASVAFSVAPTLRTGSLNELGIDALEMELAEMEARLGGLLGSELIPIRDVVRTRAYTALPERMPPDDWTQLADMTAVDTDAPGALPALAALSRAVNADIAVVLRHEWSVARERLGLVDGVSLVDRCAILVVNKQGQTVWDDAVTTRRPFRQLAISSWRLGVESTDIADEALQLARMTARDALTLLERRYRDGQSAVAMSNELAWQG